MNGDRPEHVGSESQPSPATRRAWWERLLPLFCLGLVFFQAVLWKTTTGWLETSLGFSDLGANLLVGFVVLVLAGVALFAVLASDHKQRGHA